LRVLKCFGQPCRINEFGEVFVALTLGMVSKVKGGWISKGQDDNLQVASAWLVRGSDEM
jgi:hypothetical protein